MTTDITELAQSLKAAAEKAIAEEGSTWWNEEQLASDYGLALHRTDAKFIALASHENVLALVEALEKAQTERDEFRRRFNLERSILEDADKDLETLRQRIAELESRTVTVKLPQAVSAGGQGYQAQVERILTAAGIKWEAE